MEQMVAMEQATPAMNWQKKHRSCMPTPKSPETEKATPPKPSRARPAAIKKEIRFGSLSTRMPPMIMI